jgi:hypothetical protein
MSQYIEQMKRNLLKENSSDITEDYFVEISIRDARNAADIIRDNSYFRTLNKYGSNVYATDDIEQIQELIQVLQDNDIEIINSISEMSTTAGVPGFQTPYAFGKVSDSDIEMLGYKKIKKKASANESKSTFKKMISEMYGINEASNPELDKIVKRFIDGLANKYGYQSSDAIIALFEALKRLDYIHKNVNYKAPSGFSIEESKSYRDFKKDPSSTPANKVNKGIAEVNRMLSEMEKIIHNNLRLKMETGVQPNHFWKSTGIRLAKINERLLRVSKQINELSS